MRLVPATLAVLVAPAVGAPAAGAVWSEPQQVGTAAAAITRPGVTAVSGDRAVLSWSTPTVGRDTGSALGRMEPGGHARGVQVLSADVVTPPVAVGGEAIAALTTRDLYSGDDDRKVRLSLSTGTVEGGLTRSRPLAFALLAPQSTPALATDGRGGLLAAWVEETPQRDGELRHVLRAVRRTAAGEVGRVVTLERRQAFSFEYGGQVAAALAPDGRALVAFAAGGSASSRAIHGFLARRGGPFGPRRVLGPQEGDSKLAAAFGANGRGVVAWGTQDGGEQADRPWVVRALTVPARSIVPGKAQVLDPGAGIERPLGRVAVAADTDGRVAVLWSAIAKDRQTYPVRVAQATGPAARFGAPRPLAPDGVAGDLAFGPDHALLVTWSTTAGSQPGAPPAQALAAVQPDGGAFGAPEPLGGAGGTRYDAAPRVAFLAGGAAVAAWPAKLADGTSVLRVARRDP